MSPKYAKDQPTGFKNAIERIAIVGVSGTVGAQITSHLLQGGKHTVTALTRAGSTSAKIPSGVKAVQVNYDDEATLIDALKDQQVLIITLAVQAPKDLSSKLVAAAAKAGVEYIMPNAWGPDATQYELMDSIFLGNNLRSLQKQITDANMAWVIEAQGFWYEFSLGGTPDRFGFDVLKRTVVWVGDENKVKQNTTTWKQVGLAAAKFWSLKLYPEDENDKSPTISKWTNKPFYISSFLLSQRDMFESLKRVTNTNDSDWTFTREDAKPRLEAAQATMAKGGPEAFPAFARQMYTRFLYPESPGNYEEDAGRGLDNEALGLPVEDLDAATKEAVRMAKDNDFGVYSAAIKTAQGKEE